MKTIPLRNGPAIAPRRFRYMQETSSYAETLRALGLFVTVDDNAANLSGTAYDEATKDHRYTVIARPYEVGDEVTLSGYSDCEAYTVIARTLCTLTLQADKATLLNGANSGQPDALQFAPGGFVGHTSGRQRWQCERDTSGRTVRAHFTKRGWQADGKRVSAGRFPHYDFNF